MLSATTGLCRNNCFPRLTLKRDTKAGATVSRQFPTTMTETLSYLCLLEDADYPYMSGIRILPLPHVRPHHTLEETTTRSYAFSRDTCHDLRHQRASGAITVERKGTGMLTRTLGSFVE